MLAGDIVFFRYDDFIGKVFDIFNEQAHHIAIAYDRNTIIELDNEKNVIKRKIRKGETISIYSTYNFYSKEQLDAYFTSKINTKYSYIELLFAAIYRIFKKDFKIDIKNQEICSSFVVDFYEIYSDLKLVEDKHFNITPTDILKSKKLYCEEGWHKW